MFPDAGQVSKNLCQQQWVLFILFTELQKKLRCKSSSNTVRKQVKCKNTEIKLCATCQNVCVAENKEAVAHKWFSIEYHSQCYSSEERDLFIEYVVNSTE